MEKNAIMTAIRALKQFSVEKNAARYIKEEFDQKYGGQWHCV
uniref:Dynein light chain n=1 Tax=Acrobeloides nanus TaxID=290746 RepID=A0A914D8V9_9BILA